MADIVPFNPFSGGDTPFTPYVTRTDGMDPDSDGETQGRRLEDLPLLGRSTTARGSDDNPYHQEQPTSHQSTSRSEPWASATITAPSATDPTILLLLQQMQNMQISSQEQMRAMQASALDALTRATENKHRAKPPQLQPLRSGPPGETDIIRFERHMTSYDVPVRHWAAELRTLLRGDLVGVSTAIPLEQSSDYQVLKTALLARMGVSRSTRFALLLDPKPGPTDTMSQLFHKTKDVASGCLKDCTTVADCVDLITTEIMYRQITPAVATAVRAQQPADGDTFATAVDSHVTESRMGRHQLWKNYRPRPYNNQPWTQTPSAAQQYGPHPPTHPVTHPEPPQQQSRPHPAPAAQTQTLTQTQQPPNRPPRRPPGAHKLARFFDQEKGPLCFQCKQWGHIGAQCPERQILAIDHSDLDQTIRPSHPLPALYAMGSILDTPVRFFLDSGADRTVVHQHLLEHLTDLGLPVPPPSDEATLIGFGADPSTLPVVSLPCSLLGQLLTIPMVVSGKFSHDVILGRDCSALFPLIRAAMDAAEAQMTTPPDPQILAIQTRAQTDAEQQQLQREQEEMNDPDLQPDSLADILGADFDFPQTNLSLSPTSDSDPEADPGTDTDSANAAKLIAEQKEDPTLASAWATADQPDSVFVTSNGVLHRQSTDQTDEPFLQLVLPQSRRTAALRLAHSVPMAGHVGPHRMKHKLLKLFFWPRVGQDITAFHHACDRCQKTAKRAHLRAPLTITSPPMTRPFEKVAIDIVGPLPLTKSKNRYILTYIDIGSRYPDAVPLRITTAKVVAAALLSIMTRLSVPLEILSDRGSNFLSSVMKETLAFLGIAHSKTAPYRPQSNGTVERFHHTLVQMIRKSVADKRDWDDYLPFFLFACREAPCQSTGFSPFELIFGKHVHGPLDILKRNWMPSALTTHFSSDWLLQLRSDLSQMRDIAQEKQTAVQQATKDRYDKTATTCKYAIADQVLVFSPAVSGHKGAKLQDRWCGPYSVIGQLSPVTYCVDMPDHHKRQRSVHVTALKRWTPPIADISIITEDLPTHDDLPDYHNSSPLDPPVLDPSLSTQQRTDLLQIWQEFPAVITNTLGRAKSVVHRIETGPALPIRLRPYRTPKVYEVPFKVEIDKLLKAGLIEPSSAPWAAPMFPVPKKTPGEIRLVNDYRRLNSVTLPDPYFQPRIDDTLQKMATAQYFSTFDLARGFYQVPIAPADRDKTTVVTHLGKYRFTVMPFGLKNAPATFQRLMDDLLRDLAEFTNVYIDDVAIFSSTWQDHLAHIRSVLTRLQQEGLTIQPAKSQLGVTSCTFLGHVVGHGSISPQEAKLVSIRQFQQPRSKHDVRAFLGLCGYYRHFIPHFSGIAAPLSDLTKKIETDPVHWTPQCDTAFEKLKQLLCTKPVLAPPDFSKQFYLQTDASARGIGAVLAQKDEQTKDHPVAYFSRKLADRERNYSATELEGLAVVAACRHFLPYLLGHEFTVVTDHRALSFLNDKDPHSHRLARWMDILRQFSFTIVYRPGHANANADALSRQAWADPRPHTPEGGGDVRPCPTSNTPTTVQTCKQELA